MQALSHRSLPQIRGDGDAGEASDGGSGTDGEGKGRGRRKKRQFQKNLDHFIQTGAPIVGGSTSAQSSPRQRRSSSKEWLSSVAAGASPYITAFAGMNKSGGGLGMEPSLVEKKRPEAAFRKRYPAKPSPARLNLHTAELMKRELNSNFLAMKFTK